MTIGYYRLRVHQHLRLKKRIIKACAVLNILGMLVFATNLPTADGYFSSPNQRSELLSFVISGNAKAPETAQASVDFPDALMFNEAGELQATGFSNKGSYILQNKLAAAIRLQEGFSIGDLYPPSVQLHHAASSTPALEGELQDDHLLVFFDRQEVAAWFDPAEGIEWPLAVSGEGFIDGILRFTFTGTGMVRLSADYEMDSLSTAPEVLHPEPGDRMEPESEGATGSLPEDGESHPLQPSNDVLREEDEDKQDRGLEPDPEAGDTAPEEDDENTMTPEVPGIEDGGLTDVRLG